MLEVLRQRARHPGFVELWVSMQGVLMWVPDTDHPLSYYTAWRTLGLDDADLCACASQVVIEERPRDVRTPPYANNGHVHALDYDRGYNVDAIA